MSMEKASTGSVCSPQAAANFFIDLAKRAKKPITPMQLNKLTYIAHGWVLALLNRPLFDEDVEAWQHGPVIPSLYHEFKHYGAAPIEDQAMNLEFDLQLYIPEINSEETTAKEVIRKVWDVYKGYTGAQLRNMTHQPGTPWSQVYKAGHRHVTIPTDVIKAYYQNTLSGIARNAATTTPRF